MIGFVKKTVMGGAGHMMDMEQCVLIIINPNICYITTMFMLSAFYSEFDEFVSTIRQIFFLGLHIEPS